MKKAAQLAAWATIYTSVAFTIAQGQTPPEDAFTPIRTLIHEFRGGADNDLRIEMKEESFAVLKMTETPITKEIGEQALAKHESILPDIRFTPDDEIASYQITNRRWVERTVGSPEKWFERTLQPVASFPATSWNAFVQLAIQNGLSEFAVLEAGDDRYAYTTFDALGPVFFSQGGHSVVLSPQFYEAMRVSPRYAPTHGANGFVVLIHDPHQSIAGRYQLMAGLDVFLRDNPAKVEFLVEGQFPQVRGLQYERLRPNRRIRDGGLAAHLQRVPENQREQSVYSMLQRYMIDTPMAYRLLNPGRVPDAFAIDDNSLLAEQEHLECSDTDAQGAVQTLLNVATKELANAGLSQKERANAESNLYGIAFMARALEDASGEPSDVQLLKHEQQLAELQEALAATASELSGAVPSLRSSARCLKMKAAATRAEATVYNNALARNATMSRFITEEARSADTLPIVFIGSYHTQGITEALRAKGIGYVVIEPRPTRSLRAEAEQKTFRKFLADPNHFFASQRPTNKGLAGLTPEQVENYHVPFLTKQQQLFVERTQEFDRSATSVANASVDLDSLRNSVRTNGSLTDAVVHYDGDGSVPPPPDVPAGAFAFFDHEGGRPRLILLDVKGAGWRGPGRYAFLRRARFDDLGRANDPTALRVTKYYQDPTSSKLFLLYYDRSTKRQYAIEKASTDVAGLLTYSSIRTKGTLDVHVQLSEILGGEQNVESVKRNLDPTRN